jgi:hypothetical protein
MMTYPGVIHGIHTYRCPVSHYNLSETFLKTKIMQIHFVTYEVPRAVSCTIQYRQNKHDEFCFKLRK